MRKRSRKSQQRADFISKNIGEETLPLPNYIDSLESYKNNYDNMNNMFWGPDCTDGSKYCATRIDDSYPDDDFLHYAFSLPEFSAQPAIKFGKQNDENAELLRKYYFLKYYLIYKSGMLDTWSSGEDISGCDVSGASEFIRFNDLPFSAYSGYIDEAYNTFVDSLDRIEKKSFSGLDNDSVNKLDNFTDVANYPYPSMNTTLDLFEKEYQEFIDKLKEDRTAKITQILNS